MMTLIRRWGPILRSSGGSGQTLAEVVRAWQRSVEWDQLRPGTQTNYTVYLAPLHSALKLVRITGIKRAHLLAIRDDIAADRGHGAAINFCRVASAFFSWALDRELIDASPATKLTAKLQRGHLPAWRDDQAQRAMRDLPESYRRVVVLAYYTGQRRGDLCAIRWSDYDGSIIRLTQSKTGEPLEIPVVPALQDELEAWRADRSTLTILDFLGKPWRASFLSTRLPDQLEKLGLPRLNVHGLRRLTAIRLAEAGCTVHEIAAITGHRTLSMVQEYTRGVRQRNLADAAIVRLGKKPQ